MQSTILVILPLWAVFSLSLSLPPQILPISTFNISTNGKQAVLKQLEANTDFLYFSAPSYYKSSVENISLYLLSHFRIKVIVLTCPDKSARNHQPESCVPANSHTNHNAARPILFQLKSSLPFSLFLSV